MAIKSTIYKIDLQVSDMDRNYYQQHSLTLAKHPSETDERVMVRLLGFALYANEALIFGKGLSDDEEPDLWQKDLTGAIELWMDVGLPTEKDIRKAAGRAKQVVVMLYGGRIADMWWEQNSKGLLKLNNLTVINLPDTQALANMAARSMSISCTIQDGEILVGHDHGSFDITPVILKAPSKAY
ncbi:MAG: YaeQ family protein [Methylotenera sp.]|nr:YaeQ family protein [Methylotenera sp.]